MVFTRRRFGPVSCVSHSATCDGRDVYGHEQRNERRYAGDKEDAGT